jgi:hypothetical protein
VIFDLLIKAGLLDLASAAVYAVATYGFFRFLNRIASPQASKTISAWVRREPLGSLDLSREVRSGVASLTMEARLSKSGLGSEVHEQLVVYGRDHRQNGKTFVYLQQKAVGARGCRN